MSFILSLCIITGQMLTVSWGKPECVFLKYWWQWKLQKLSRELAVIWIVYTVSAPLSLQLFDIACILICFLLSTSSGVSLSLLSLYSSLLSSISIQHVTRGDTVIYAANLSMTRTITHTKYGKAVIYIINLSVTHLYGSMVIYASLIRSMVNLTLEAHVRYPLYILIIVNESITLSTH